jgi:hypothetical protein
MARSLRIDPETGATADEPFLRGEAEPHLGNRLPFMEMFVRHGRKTASTVLTSSRTPMRSTSSKSGANYGWRVMETDKCFNFRTNSYPASCIKAGYADHVYTWQRTKA